MATKKVQTELETLSEIQLALQVGPVWCDVVNPDIIHVIVRNVRKFAIHKLDMKELSDNEWTSKFNQGKAKGYEVLIMEGWRVPEKVLCRIMITEEIKEPETKFNRENAKANSPTEGIIDFFNEVVPFIVQKRNRTGRSDFWIGGTCKSPGKTVLINVHISII